MTHRVVIVGGGFGGLYAARGLKDAAVNLTMVDRRNFHLFQPLLYQVATGALSPGEIAEPLRVILRRQKNAEVLLAEAIGLDPATRVVRTSDGGEIPYDTLIVATGARHAYFGRDDWAKYAPGLKTIEDATEMRRRVLIAFEAAEREADPARRRAWMTFVVVGGGPTGAELAGALGEIANDSLKKDFRRIRPPDARIILVEALDRILVAYPEGLSEKAKRQLQGLGVEVRTRTKVTEIDGEGVALEAAGRTERLDARTVLWAAGVQASTFGRVTADAVGAEQDRAGRVIVDEYLTIPGHPEIFIIGDLAAAKQPNGKPVPGVAPAAIQEGRYVGKAIRARLDGEPGKPFAYRDKGNLATIGRAKGVADLGRARRFSGFIAWFLWLAVHVWFLIGFQNRLLVMIRWGWSFVTSGRGTRLITGAPLLPEIRDPDDPER